MLYKKIAEEVFKDEELLDLITVDIQNIVDDVDFGSYKRHGSNYAVKEVFNVDLRDCETLDDRFIFSLKFDASFNIKYDYSPGDYYTPENEIFEVDDIKINPKTFNFIVYDTTTDDEYNIPPTKDILQELEFSIYEAVSKKVGYSSSSWL